MLYVIQYNKNGGKTVKGNLTKTTQVCSEKKKIKNRKTKYINNNTTNNEPRAMKTSGMMVCAQLWLWWLLCSCRW